MGFRGGKIGAGIIRPPPASSGDYTVEKETVLEMFVFDGIQDFGLSQDTSFKENSYDVNGNLTLISIYSDTQKAVKISEMTLSYNEDSTLASTTFVRVSDGKTITKNFLYNGEGELVSVELSFV